MLPAALGHCEDPECQSKSSESVRLFRCSIHCDRNLCLFHLNAHNIYYEEEKKQNTIIINELQNTLSLYQTIFEKQIISYRELVRQSSSILLHNTSSLVPIEQIRPILEKLQQAIAVFHEEKVIIKCEPALNTNENVEQGQKVVVRIPRIECNVNNNQTENENQIENDENAIKLPDDPQGAKKVSDGKKTKTRPLKRLQK